MSYVTDVATLFLSRCQNIQILSPVDYETIAEWEKQNIPLTVVFDSLNFIFDNLQQNTELGNIESIGDFQNEVKINFANWLHNFKDIE
jgi:hypothetical protein